MDPVNLVDYIDDVLRMALQKCRNASEAEELAQETLLSALVALNKGQKVENPEAWLRVLLNRRHADRLRVKYRCPLVTMAQDGLSHLPDLVAEPVTDDRQLHAVRRELSRLTSLYRDVMVRYYVQRQSIREIASALLIPEGTVLSRLDAGRTQIRNGVKNMDGYEAECYRPQRLGLGINGRVGRNGEPFPAVNSSLLNQNILIKAYPNPVTEKEIAEALGVSTAYVEDSVAFLVDQQLMVRTGKGKVYTDLIISDIDEHLRIVNLCKEFAGSAFDRAWPVFEAMIRDIDAITGFGPMNREQKAICTVLDITFRALNSVVSEVCPTDKTAFDYFPERPNGGKWYAAGSRYEPERQDHQEVWRYSCSGQLSSEDVSDEIARIWDWHTDVGHTHAIYENGAGGIKQAELAKLLYDLHTGGEADPYVLAQLPKLEGLGLVTRSEGACQPAIPLLAVEEYSRYEGLIREYSEVLGKALKDLAVPLYHKVKPRLPAHIGFPMDLLLGKVTHCVPMAFVYLANEKGLIHLDPNKTYPVMCMVLK